MEIVRGPDDVAVHAALAAWRSKATNILLAVSAAGHLPVIVVVLLGDGHSNNPTCRGCLGTYRRGIWFKNEANAVTRRQTAPPKPTRLLHRAQQRCGESM